MHGVTRSAVKRVVSPEAGAAGVVRRPAGVGAVVGFTPDE
jgi:hypothetical protein